MMDISNYLPKIEELKLQKSVYKTRRAEIIGEAVKDINLLRGDKFRHETEIILAIKVNRNPFLKSDTELELLISYCREKRNYSKLYFTLK